MQTGLTQKPTADAAGGSRACALTLHGIIAATRFLAKTIARAVCRKSAQAAVEIAGVLKEVASESLMPHDAPRQRHPQRRQRRHVAHRRGNVGASENLSHVPEPFTLIRRSSCGLAFLLFYHFPRHCFPT